MFKVGDLVMFKNRCQNCMTGMTVQEVDTNMFDTKIKVDYKWWSPECFMSYDEWEAKHGNSN